MRSRAFTAIAAIAALLCLLAVPPLAEGAARDGRARPLLGVVSQTDSIAPRDVTRMKRAGVGTIRFVAPWSRLEPQPGVFRWQLLDAKLLAASAAGAVPTATVFGAPQRYGAQTPPPTSSPAQLADWLAFLEALVDRYGPGGAFVEDHPGVLPIRRWQIWNEPNLTAFWGETEPSPAGYVRLLDASAERIRAADPGATVITAGLSPAARGIDPRRFLGRMYRAWDERGEQPSFDELALHPYAQTVRASRRAIEQAIAVAERWNDPRPPLTIAEIAWGSGGPPGYPLAGTPGSQARKLTDAFGMLLRHRRAWNLRAVYWYSLRDLPGDVDACGFCDFTGLIGADGRAKPAWDAFRKVLAGRG